MNLAAFWGVEKTRKNNGLAVVPPGPGIADALGMEIRLWITFWVLFLATPKVQAVPSVFYDGPFSEERGGYVDDARRENPDVGQPLELMTVPQSIRNRTSFQSRLFDAQLSKELQQKYEDQFGRTRVEVFYRHESRYGTYESASGEWTFPVQQSEKEVEFANFMLRRMLEYHLDRASKTEPSLKQAYQIKEKVTNYEVSVMPGIGFKSHYSLSGNYIDAQLLNAYVGARVRWEMDPAQLGPTEVRETRISLDRELTARLKLDTYYALVDGIASFVLRRTLTPFSNVSLTASSYLKASGYTRRETLGLLGYALLF